MTKSPQENTSESFTFSYDKNIQAHYNFVAQKDADSPNSTMADMFVRKSETSFIVNSIKKYCQEKQDFTNAPSKKLKILDVGCGNGYTLETLIDYFPEHQFWGLEPNDELRGIANNRFNESNVSVTKGDIRLKDSMTYNDIDILICQRVIINLLDRQHQKEALNNIINQVKEGGLLIFIECFDSGLSVLNNARQEFDLPPLPPAHHNLYLNDSFFDNEDIAPFETESSNFLSTHYYVSRVLDPYLLQIGQKEFIRNSHFVSFLSEALPHSIGHYSPLRFLSFIKI